MVNEFERCFSGLILPHEKKTDVFCAKEYMVAGLKKLFGDKAMWVPEYDEIEKWLKDNHGKGLLCMGEYGRGKTVMCEYILPAIINRNDFGGGNEPTCCTLSAYSLAYTEEIPFNRGWIMIDDVGVESEQVNYGTRRILFNEIIDEAEHNKNVLILTTNLNIEELEAKYGVRTIDRLRAITTPVIFKGESLRGRIESQYVLP